MLFSTSEIQASVFVTSLIYVITFSTSSISAQAPAFLTREEIYKQSMERQDAIKNLKVRYKNDWRLISQVPNISGLINLVPTEVVFIYKGERRYLEINVLTTGRKLIAYFDGDHTYSPRAGFLTITDGKSDQCEQHEFYCREILNIPYRDQDLVNLEEKWTFFPRSLSLQRDGSPVYRVLPDQELIDGSMCHVLEYELGDKVWIDPKMGCAIRKREHFKPSDGGRTMLARYQLSDFVMLPPNVWAPMKCVRLSFPPPSVPPEYLNKPFLELSISVKSLEINNVNDDDFDFPLPPGTLVVHKGNSYQIKGDKEVLLSELAKPVSNNTLSKRHVVLILSLLLLLFTLFLLGYRYYRKSRLPSSPSTS